MDSAAPAPTKPPINGATSADVFARTIERLLERQRERPWLMGLTSIALAQAVSIPEAELIGVLEPFIEAGLLVYRSGYYATADHTPRLSVEQDRFFDHLFSVPPGVPFAPLPFEALRAGMRASAGSIPDLAQAFETLVACGALSKVGDFVYRGSHIATIRAQLEDALAGQGELTVAQFRTLTGTSRKYAVPLLEFFDAAGLTQRRGDLRVLRRTSPRTDA